MRAIATLRTETAVAALTLLLGAASVVGASVEAVSQARTTVAFVTATTPEDFSHDSIVTDAEDFDLFDHTDEITEYVAGSSGFATAHQRSHILPLSFYFLGDFHAEAEIDSPDAFAEAFGQAFFSYTFTVSEPTGFSVYGQLDATGGATCNLSFLGTESILQIHVENGSEALVESGTLMPGQYQFTVHTGGFGQAFDDFTTEADGEISIEFFFNPLVGVPGAGDVATVLSAHPNPSRGAVTFELSSDIGGSALTIHDASGRLVRTLPAVARSRVAWDGTTNSGQAVAPGVYFYRMDGSADARRLVITR